MNDRKQRRRAFLRWMGNGAMLLSLLGGLGGTGAVAADPGMWVSQQVTPDSGASAGKASFEEGMRLYEQRTAESLRAAIVKFIEALQLLRLEKNHDWEVIARLSMVRANSDLGRKRQALEYLRHSLALSRKGMVTGLDSMSGQASTLRVFRILCKRENQ